MFQNYRPQLKWQKKAGLIIIKIFILSCLHTFGQEDTLLIKKEPFVSISVDSAKSILYNENTTPLEVVIRNILGVVDVNPSYFMEQTEFMEFAAHVKELNFENTRNHQDSSLDSIFNFQFLLSLKNETKESYLSSGKIKFNYRWIRAAHGREAIITVNNDKIYLLRRISGFWKIYVWSNIDFYDSETYEIFDDN